MRVIKYIALHCTATQPTATVASIQRYWREEKGWKNPGYHILIAADGKAHDLLPVSEISNGVAGYNSVTINICYIGGVDKQGKPADTRTPAQLVAMQNVVEALHSMFPKAVIQGHRDFPGVKKACPSFDVKTWLKAIGL